MTPEVSQKRGYRVKKQQLRKTVASYLSLPVEIAFKGRLSFLLSHPLAIPATRNL
jgi:hypothetical protein